MLQVRRQVAEAHAPSPDDAPIAQPFSRVAMTEIVRT